jgi:hypothetical protein
VPGHPLGRVTHHEKLKKSAGSIEKCKRNVLRKSEGFIENCITNVRAIELEPRNEIAPEAQSLLAPRFSVGKKFHRFVTESRRDGARR